MGAEGEFALVREHLQKGLYLSGQPVKRGTMAHEHDVYALLADIASRQRDVAGLRQYAPKVEELATRDNHKLYLAVAHRAWGVAHRLAGEYAEAEARFNLALEMFQQLGTGWQMGRTLAEMGELARSRSKVDAAREYFSQAMAAFEGMKAMTDLEQTRLALEAVG